MVRGDAPQSYKCDFCSKSQKQVKRLIAGPGVYICDECISVCSEMIEEEFAEKKTREIGASLPKPREICDFLDTYVIGQDRAKRSLSVAVYNHYKRTRNEKRKTARRSDAEDVEMGKSNVLLIGPTGCGKTYLAQTLARMLDVPFAMCDATALTEAGYVGEDVENILLKLIQAADFDIKRAETGIIYIDEIDKVARKAENPSITRDVSGEGVQQALLKIIEGTVAAVPPQGGRKHPHQDFLEIDTRKILFIVGGAFAGLEEIVGRRVGKQPIGFASAQETKRDLSANPLDDVQPEDLHSFGLIPEFVGRLPMITNVAPLDKTALMRILTEPKNALTKQYQKLLDLDGVELEFTPDAVEGIAELALARGTGARGLRSIVEELLLDVMFEVPSDEDVVLVRVTAEAVSGDERPQLITRDEIEARRGLSA